MGKAVTMKPPKPEHVKVLAGKISVLQRWLKLHKHGLDNKGKKHFWTTKPDEFALVVELAGSPTADLWFKTFCEFCNSDPIRRLNFDKLLYHTVAWIFKMVGGSFNFDSLAEYLHLPALTFKKKLVFMGCTVKEKRLFNKNESKANLEVTLQAPFNLDLGHHQRKTNKKLKMH